MATLLYLCPLDELKDKTTMGVDPFSTGSDTLFAVYKEEQVYLYKNQCPHEPVSLEYKKNRFLSKDKKNIICYAHGARFEPTTGLCIYGPCLGKRLVKVNFQLIDNNLYLEQDTIA
ncbi:Rieske [2Fe-2S] domain protein [Marinomonas spartinae]|uniref:Rieske [2Fe-2S] domain protein n=1 Tax=Marinomonas spartinae TaxID=1792290 RepID=A0A1A8TRA5_9GAMM|nr:Rieske 2Fe-2S domain-containing protein [Marinomonas spartinae]SBS29479.1 Rieske [2Fe-2S] domain protein [Marinomonas spartinae]SBS37020.1 Rieske [2Fe-2S] domain protein [Marinomonas spartinae]